MSWHLAGDVAALIVATLAALALGVFVGRMIVGTLRRKAAKSAACAISDEGIEDRTTATLRAAREARIESERLNRDLRGAIHV